MYVAPASSISHLGKTGTNSPFCKAEATRRWISVTITDFSSKGFTILAVLDPTMHATEEANAILNLFDGEISITQTEDPLECKKSIQVKKLRNQDYIKNPICLTNK